MPVVYLLLVALVVWYVLEHTPLGRYMYALGGSKEASRLAGLNVARLTVITFTLTGFLCGVGGVIQAASLGVGNPSVGPPLLLPAFAAAFHNPRSGDRPAGVGAGRMGRVDVRDRLRVLGCPARGSAAA